MVSVAVFPAFRVGKNVAATEERESTEVLGFDSLGTVSAC